MEIAPLAIIAAIILAGTLIFSLCLVRCYIKPANGTCLISFGCVLAISSALWCVLLIPADVYTVSSNLTSTGAQSDPELVASTGDAMKVLYYIFYCVLIAFAFFILPFLYFFFEEQTDEDEPTSSCASRCCTAFKYMIVFIILFGVVLTLAFVLKKDKADQSGDWKDRLAEDFSNADQVISFMVAALALYGLTAFVLYTAYGMAMLPLGIIRSRKSTLAEDKLSLLAEERKLDEDIVRQNEQNKFLTARYEAVESYKQAGAGGKAGSAATPFLNEREVSEARAQRRLLEARSKNLQDRKNVLERSSDCCIKCWNACAPIRIAVGVALLLLSLFIATSLTISVVDKFMHSNCAWACGWTIDSPAFINPIDEGLRVLSKAFPIDLLAFGGLAVYLFFCAVTGLCALGVRFIVFKLYSFERGNTAPNGMVMGAWLLMFVTLVINQQVLTLAPQYASFGEQFYFGPPVLPPAPAPHNGTSGNGTTPNATALAAQFEGLRVARLSAADWEWAVPADRPNPNPAAAAANGGAAAAVFAGIESLDDSVQAVDASASAADAAVVVPQGRASSRLRLLSSASSAAATTTGSAGADDSAPSSLPLALGAAVGAPVGNATAWSKQPCSIGLSNLNGTWCVLSQVSLFLHKTNTQTPFFGIVQFVANLVFLGFFFLFLLYGIFSSAKSSTAKPQSDDPDAPNYVRPVRLTTAASRKRGARN